MLSNLEMVEKDFQNRRGSSPSPIWYLEEANEFNYF